MSPVTRSDTASVLAGLDEGQEWVEQLYRDLHAHPELSMQEHRTVARIAGRLAESGYAVEHVGGGVIGVLSNGPGPCVLFRADIDALPITENTGLPYASTVTAVNAEGETVGVMHACGHDVHVACGLGAADLLARNRDRWSGTYVALFQPGEETGVGARSMVEAGLAEHFPTPVVALAQHVLPDCDAGHVSLGPGVVMGATTSIKITIHGVSSHGTMPHLGVDPIVIAAAIVGRLQSIVSREVAPGQFGVVTVGSFHAGTRSNAIPTSAELLVNVRSYHKIIHRILIQAIERVVRGECATAGTPLEPEFVYYDVFPVTDNDPRTAAEVQQAFVGHFGAERVHRAVAAPATEDFSVIPDALGCPYTYWSLGGFPAGRPRIHNHDPAFAPVIQPTLRTGTEAAVVAALAFLGPPAGG